MRAVMAIVAQNPDAGLCNKVLGYQGCNYHRRKTRASVKPRKFLTGYFTPALETFRIWSESGLRISDLYTYNIEVFKFRTPLESLTWGLQSGLGSQAIRN